MYIGPTTSLPLAFGSSRQNTLRPTLSLDRSAIDAFAGEMTRRASQTEPGSQARTVDDKGLSAALTNSVEYVRNTFGDNAGRAVMGIVLGHAGQGPLTEETLGDGFVSALRFIDTNFGTAAGDQAMGFFNGELNQALNGYFQNGKQESFLAVDVDSATAAAGQALQLTAASVMAKAQDAQGGGADPAAALFDQVRKDDGEYQAAGQAEPGADGITPDVEAGAGAAGIPALPRAQGAVTTLDGQPESQGDGNSGQPGAQAAGTSTRDQARKPRTHRIRRRRPNRRQGYGASSITPGVLVNTKV